MDARDRRVLRLCNTAEQIARPNFFPVFAAFHHRRKLSVSNPYRKKMKPGSANERRYLEWCDRFAAAQREYAEPRLSVLMGEAVTFSDYGKADSIRSVTAQPAVGRGDPAPTETG